MLASHGAITRELLIRHLDTWTPTVLHGHRRVTYGEAYPHAEADSSTIAALRVFGEFSDLLDRHRLVMVLAATPQRGRALAESLHGLAERYGPPIGLSVDAEGGPDLVTALRRSGAFGSPILAFFDGYAGPVPAPTTVAAAVSADGQGAAIGSEVLLAVAASDPAADAYPRHLADAGLGRHCQVELVDDAGQAQLLIFATASEHSLERFKDELWALDEYGGIRYRDPRDPGRALLDITLEPHLGPLRRMLGTRLASAPQTLAQLRGHALHETIYRAGDANRAVHSLLEVGAARRTPATGRLTGHTLISPVAAPTLDQ